MKYKNLKFDYRYYEPPVPDFSHEKLIYGDKLDDEIAQGLGNWKNMYGFMVPTYTEYDKQPEN